MVLNLISKPIRVTGFIYTGDVEALCAFLGVETYQAAIWHNNSVTVNMQVRGHLKLSLGAYVIRGEDNKGIPYYYTCTKEIVEKRFNIYEPKEGI